MAEVKGLDRLERQLAGLADAHEKALSHALENAAYETADAVEAAAPRHTGTLAHSVGYVAGGPPDGAAFTTGKTGSDEATAALGSRKLLFSVFAGSREAYWARFVEFGTRAGTKGDRVTNRQGTRKVQRNHPGTKAQPFFFPTIRARLNRNKAAIRAGARAAIKATQAQQ